MEIIDSNDILTSFFSTILDDPRITPMHVAVYFALFRTWSKKGCHSTFQTSRQSIMRKARIRSTATYHKMISELSQWGYLRYQPSYHPALGSSFSLSSSCGE